ncbi:MAG: hypothetical protein EBT68_01255 [Verrucomicrobia bacterium]|nr:hypothetical protein [Verrucomicrobiota bacterium]
MAAQRKNPGARRSPLKPLSLFGLLVGALIPQVVQAYESAYRMTAAGICEIKTLPAGVILRTSARGDYFEENNGLFMRLFQTINQNKVPMTVPVEARMKPGTMVFYLDAGSAGRENLQLPKGVSRQVLPERMVASIGIRGGYSRESYEQNLAKLREWLKTQPLWRAAGEPYGVYWNSPFMVPFLKRSEIHIPVLKKNK